MTPPVVLAHDYLTQRGGGERVALEFTRQFPEAPLLTSVYQREETFPEFDGVDVRTSFLNRCKPFRRDPRIAFGFLPAAIRQMPVPEGVLLVSSSGWAHGLRARGPKIVYCHNPARWLYQPHDYFPTTPSAVRWMLSSVLSPLRWWDRRAARTADHYLANSTAVAERIHSAYGVRATVVHPPAGLDSEGVTEAIPGVEPGFFLTVGRRRGYKNTALVCAAVEQTPGVRLLVVGGSPTDDGERVTTVRGISDAQLRWAYANCRAVVAMSHEDFGLAPVEGYRFGRPSICLRAGGYLDSGLEGVATVFVDEESVEALALALAEFDDAAFDPAAIRAHSEKFSRETFGRRLRETIAHVHHRKDRGRALQH
ncbi:glycosyltransferase [Kineococcus gynurae]|uniref:Glycosyltransferase n=1 Tax=Kineococcus gynurae TaxID=452979 RepID=A0ABV5LNQ7_9ACTN